MRVAVTIDAEHADRPASSQTPARMLDLLARETARATIFVQGRWAAANPVLARRIAEDGHLVGNHSLSHAPVDHLTDDGITHSVQEAERTIRDATGADPRPWFRCPYGDGHDDPRVLAALERLGYRNVEWDVDPADWDDRPPEDIAEDSVAGCLAHGDGALLLLHVWPDATLAALPTIIGRLRAEGAELVGVDEL
jgi:peptidoglycan/xylan/chitin deacetylase (PgdA/CDA1 family)